MSDHDTQPILIALEQLRANEDYQPRLAGIREQHVRLLVSTDPAAWPPLLVSPNEEAAFNVIDGFHRLEAAHRLGLPALPCLVDRGAGYPEAVLANLWHGLPLSLMDRKEAARWLAEQEPGLSYRELGRRVGLNHETVKRALEDGNPEAPGSDRRRSQPDPVARLVRQVWKAYDAGHGRTWLGLGQAGNARPFRRELETYREEDRGDIARAMDAFGRACVAAAAPYVSREGER